MASLGKINKIDEATLTLDKVGMEGSINIDSENVGSIEIAVVGSVAGSENEDRATGMPVEVRLRNGIDNFRSKESLEVEDVKGNVEMNKFMITNLA